LKKLLFIGIAFLFAFAFVGCNNSNEDISAPSNLVLSASSDGTDVILEWDASSATDIDGYIVKFNGTALTADPIADVTTYTHNNPTTTGSYEVVAVKGDTESDPATASTAPTTEVTSGAIYYEGDGLGTHPSGFGWNTNGSGQTYSLTASHSDLDIYMDTDEDLSSATNKYGDANACFILDSWTVGSPIPWPVNDINYGTSATGTEAGNVFLAAVAQGDGFHFVKCTTADYVIGDHSVKIKWQYQLIANLRLL
jgi:hypothetical protein